MNSFGRLFRISILGESHGAAIGVLIDGCPAGLALGPADFEPDLARRRAGARGTTPRKERDAPRLVTGLLEGRTTGAPVLIEFDNLDVQSKAYDELRHRPRPGHADLPAITKFGGFADWRGGGHFSGRLTAALVAAGVVAKRFLPGLSFDARVLEAGGQTDTAAAVEEAERDNDSIGGVVECVVRGLPAGLGEPFFNSVESMISHIAFAIPGVKGVEFGAGMQAARMRGSDYADAILDKRGRTRTNHAGGINGGISNGNPLVFRIALRPPSTSAAKLHTVDLRTGKQVTVTPGGRHDRCFALRVPVVLEAVAAIALADLMLVAQQVPRVVAARRKP